MAKKTEEIEEIEEKTEAELLLEQENAIRAEYQAKIAELKDKRIKTVTKTHIDHLVSELEKDFDAPISYLMVRVDSGHTKRDGTKVEPSTKVTLRLGRRPANPESTTPEPAAVES